MGPIFVSADIGLVTPSAAAVYAIRRFFSVAVDRCRFVTRLGFSRAPGGCRLGERKVSALDVVELLPAPKRRLFFSSEEGGRDQKRLAIGDRVPEISLESYANAAKAMMRGNFPPMKFESQYTHCGNSTIPLRIDTNGECSGCPEPNFELRVADNDAITSMFQEEISVPIIEGSDSLFMTGNNLTCQKVVGTDRFMHCIIVVNLDHPNHFQETLLCNGALGSIGFEKKMDHFDTFGHE